LFLQRWRWLLRQHTPAGARIAVVSRGDDELLRLQERELWHFQRDGHGHYLGHHPADDAEAIAHLDAAVAGGAQFLALPAPSRWWLEYYPELQRHLNERFRLLETNNYVGIIYDMRVSQDRP